MSVQGFFFLLCVERECVGGETQTHRSTDFGLSVRLCAMTDPSFTTGAFEQFLFSVRDFFFLVRSQQKRGGKKRKKSFSELRILPWARALRIQVADSRIQQETHTCPTCPVRPAVTTVRGATVEPPVRLPRLRAGNMLLGGHSPHSPGRVLACCYCCSCCSCASDCFSLVMRVCDWRWRWWWW